MTLFAALWHHASMYDERQPALLAADRLHLVRAAARLLGPADAEDAVQDAYVRALEADTLALNSAQAWLLTVVRNLAIDRLRRRNWMQQWLSESLHAGEPVLPSTEADAALAQEVTHALQQLALHLAPEDGAALLLHAVFEMDHAEIAKASGRSEAASRQQLRRALLRLRQAGSASDRRTELETDEATVFRLFLQSLQLRDPQTLWAMLRQPPIQASAQMACATAAATPSQATHCGVVQAGGQLGLVLTLDGVHLCVLPLGVLPEPCAH